MKLPHFSIARPVTVTMFYIGAMLLGTISVGRLPQELFPPIVFPQLTVVTIYPNASPEEVENQVSKKIEEGVGTVSGLQRVSSKSKEGLSLVMAQFGWNQNMDIASLNLREKIDLIKARLPQDTAEPIVMKFNPFELPSLRLSVTSKELGLYRLKVLCKKFIKDNLEKIDGVASANVTGGIDREIVVEIDQDKLDAAGLSVIKISDAIAAANVNTPGGTIKESFFEYLIRAIGEYQSISEIAELPITVDDTTYPDVYFKEHDVRSNEQKEREKRIIYVGDVAVVKDTFRDQKSFSRYNGVDNISISIQKQAGANTIETVRNVKKALKSIKRDLPNHITFDISYDQSVFIKQSIDGVKNSALQGGVLVFFVLLIFLRSLKSALIVTFSIPISVMFAFTMMYFGKLTLNMMSLGGLALGVGMLVDNAVVVIENIFRHEQLGKDPKTAATDGSVEVSAAIFSSTLTTVAVFLPMVFVIGIAGQLFKQLSLTITYSLLASLLVAMTLIPLLSSRGKKKAGQSMTEKELARLDIERGLEPNVFTRFLRAAMKVRWLTLFIVFCVFAGSMSLFGLVEKELMPKVDQGQFIIKLQMPSGTKVQVTDRVVRRLESALQEMEKLKSIATTVGSSASGNEIALETLGSNQGEIIIDIAKGPSEKEVTPGFIEKLKLKIENIDLEKGQIEYILQESAIKAATSSDAPVVVDITGVDLFVMNRMVREVKARLSTIKGIYGIADSAVDPSPEIKIFVDKERAMFHGLSVKDIGVTAKVGIQGFITSTFKSEREEVPIRVRLAEKYRSNFNYIRRLSVSSSLGMNVPLKEVSFFGRGKGPTEITRVNQQRIISVYANILNRSLADVYAEVQYHIDQMKIQESYSVKIGGEAEEREASFKSLSFALILSILLVYMIMASQFESLWQPFVIMLCHLPLSAIRQFR